MAFPHVQAGELSISLPTIFIRLPAQGFIDPKVKPTDADGKDQDRMAKIFKAWLGTENTPNKAKEAGTKVGKLIAERAAQRCLELGLVWDCVRQAAEFYGGLFGELQAKASAKLSSEGALSAKSEERVSERQVARLMLSLFTAASEEMMHACDNEKRSRRRE